MPSAVVGTIVQAVKSVAMPTTCGGVDAGLREGGGYGDAQHVDVVARRPAAPTPGASGVPSGSVPVEDGVRVVVGRGAELVAVGDPDHEGPAGQGAEVDADDDAVGVGRLAHGLSSSVM